MIKSPRAQPVPTFPALLRSRTFHQLSMRFDSTVTLDLSESEKASVITQLATLLLQAAGQGAGGDDGQH